MRSVIREFYGIPRFVISMHFVTNSQPLLLTFCLLENYMLNLNRS